MKLKDLKIIVTRPPPPGWGGRYWIFVKLTTDNGIVGWGECYASSIGPEAMEVVIKDIFERYFLDEALPILKRCLEEPTHLASHKGLT